MGQRASTGLSTCKFSWTFGSSSLTDNYYCTVNTFWCYVTPIVGAWIADEFLGRLATIQGAIAFAMVGHIIIIISAIPQVIVHPNGSIACFAIGLVVFGIGVGGFK